MNFTVTKKVRPKQSADLNYKAWDNEASALGPPFRLLLVLEVLGRLWGRVPWVGVSCLIFVARTFGSS